MNSTHQKRLEAAGWKIGTAEEFLGLTSADSAYIEMKVRLTDGLEARRKQRRLTQEQLAEASDPTAPLDHLIRSHLALGSTPEDIAKLIAG